MSFNYPLLFTLALEIFIASLLLVAAAHDIMTRTVPNWMPLALAILCVVTVALDHRLVWGVGFGVATFASCVLFWRRGWMGGADVKLLGATAIVVPAAAAGTFLMAVTVSGGILAIVYLAGRVFVPRPVARRPRRLIRRVLRVEAWRIRHRGPLPYACAIAAGTIFVLS